MNQIEFFYYANCTSCKKADAFLRAEGISATRRDFFKHRLSVSELNALFERAGVTVRDVLSTRSRPYQDLKLAEQELSDAQIVELMAEYPQLLRRPLLLAPSGTVIGFNQGAYEALPASLALSGKDA
jgi:Spx/MgsR family transcriptional regulator